MTFEILFYVFVIYLTSITKRYIYLGNTFTSYLHRVNVLYNKAFKIVLSVPPTAHIISRISQLNVLAFDDPNVYNCFVFIFKVYNNLLPDILYNVY